MPSLANIYCHGVPSGLTLTGNLYPDGSDTAAATGLTVTEATNRKTTYVLNAGVTGLHLIHLLSGSNVVWVGWTPPNLAITGDFEACETRREALNLDAQISDVPAAVRDVSNASPAAGSLGEGVNEAATSSTNAVSYITTVVNRLGAFTGTGVNTVLGLLKAIMSKAASTPSDVGGTFSAATDSLEAIKDAGGGGGGGGEVTSFSAEALNQLSARTITVNSVTRSARDIDVHIGCQHSGDEDVGTAWVFTDAAGVYPHDGTWWIEVRDANATAVGTVAWVSGNPGESTIFRGEMTAAQSSLLSASGGKGKFWVLQRLTDGAAPILRWHGNANLLQAQRAS